MVLPPYRFVAIRYDDKSKNKYFRPSGPNGEVKYEAVKSDHNVKHEVVPSTVKQGFFHLKCVNTGKYWSWGKIPASSTSITAQQEKRVEKEDDAHSTLIRCGYSTIKGVTVYHLHFLVHKKWHNMERNSLGLLISGEKRGGEHAITGFIFENWPEAEKAIRNKNNTGAGTSTGNPGTGAGTSTGNPGTGAGASTTNTYSGGGPTATGGGAALALANLTISGGTVSFGK